MGVEDRDWYREEPSKAWKRRWARTEASTSGGGLVRTGAWLAILVSAVVTAVAWRFDLVTLRLQAREPEPSPKVEPAQDGQAVQTPAKLKPRDTNAIRLRSRPGFDVPAKVPTRWSVTGDPFGTVSVVVPVGTTPREALTLALAERGIQVLE